jgi:hypothetical protein
MSKMNTGIPEGWSRVDGVTGYLHGGEITSVYTNGRSVVILGDPDEDGGHNCDQMECGQSHVLVRLFDACALPAPPEKQMADAERLKAALEAARDALVRIKQIAYEELPNGSGIRTRIIFLAANGLPDEELLEGDPPCP